MTFTVIYENINYIVISCQINLETSAICIFMGYIHLEPYFVFIPRKYLAYLKATELYFIVN